MTAQLRSELLKMRTTRTNLGLFLGMVALVLTFVLLNGLLQDNIELWQHDTQAELLGVGTSGALFASLIGIMAVTSEFRHGTIRSTFVVCPRRGRVMLAKVLASLALGLVFGVLAEGLALGVGLLVIRGRGVDLLLDSADIRGIVLGAIAMTMLFAALGVGIGGVVRNQVFAVVGLLVWLLVVENILFGVVPSVGRYTPGKAAAALAGADQSQLLSTASGGLVLLGWVVVFVLAGSIVTARRDVS